MNRRLSYFRTKSPFRGGSSRRRSVSRRRTGGSPNRRRSVTRISPSRYYYGGRTQRKTREERLAEANEMYNNVENAGVKQVADAIKTLQNLSIGERNALMAALRVEDVKRAARAARARTPPPEDDRLYYILEGNNTRCQKGFSKIRHSRDYQNDDNRVLRSECLRNGAWEWPPVVRRTPRAKIATAPPGQGPDSDDDDDMGSPPTPQPPPSPKAPPSPDQAPPSPLRTPSPPRRVKRRKSPKAPKGTTPASRRSARLSGKT